MNARKPPRSDAMSELPGFKPEGMLADKTYKSTRIVDKSQWLKDLEAWQRGELPADVIRIHGHSTR